MVTDSRVVAEGYGPGEIALHHAFCTRAVRAQLSGIAAEPFVLAGDDWFALSNERALPWKTVEETVAVEHDRLTTVIGDLEAGRATSPMSETERSNVSLGIACHAVYHAGQIQLIKRLKEV